MKLMYASLIVCMMFTVGCQVQGNVQPLVTETSLPIVATPNPSLPNNQEAVYAFLDEVATFANEVNYNTYDNKEEIVAQYEKYFSTELSKQIVDGLFVEQDQKFVIITGDPGYLFIPPTGNLDEGEKVDLRFEKDHISIVVTYEIGLYSKIEYRIEQLDGLKITKWEFQ